MVDIPGLTLIRGLISIGVCVGARGCKHRLWLFRDSDTDTDSEIELEDNDLIVGMSTDSGSDSDDDNN